VIDKINVIELNSHILNNVIISIIMPPPSKIIVIIIPLNSAHGPRKGLFKARPGDSRLRIWTIPQNPNISEAMHKPIPEYSSGRLFP
jgi:hypothetical protein